LVVTDLEAGGMSTKTDREANQKGKAASSAHDRIWRMLGDSAREPEKKEPFSVEKSWRNE